MGAGRYSQSATQKGTQFYARAHDGSTGSIVITVRRDGCCSRMVWRRILIQSASLAYMEIVETVLYCIIRQLRG